MLKTFKSKNTVIIRLMGGLGNQMFQYSAALSLAARLKKRLQLDISACRVNKSWCYQLNRLNIPQDICTEAVSTGSLSKTFLARVVDKLNGNTWFRNRVYREPHFHFDPAFFRLTGDRIILEGYFQSPRYFEGVEALLREQFQLKVPLTQSAAEWASRIDASRCSVSVHVRRGDYLTGKAAAVHPALDRSYYDRAIALMLDLVGPEAEFFLFSDEPDFLAKFFTDLPRAHVVCSDPSAPWEDMFLMARCRHNIIANSTYSWWGAWLNPAKNKRIIAPARWFTSKQLATCNVLDLYPDDWILLK